MLPRLILLLCLSLVSYFQDFECWTQAEHHQHCLSDSLLVECVSPTVLPDGPEAPPCLPLVSFELGLPQLCFDLLAEPPVLQVEPWTLRPGLRACGGCPARIALRGPPLS